MSRARLTTLAMPVTTASLALVTAAWAATGDLPLIPADRLQPLAVTAQATGPLVSNDLDGSALFSSDALAPGETRSGEVTIRNAGDGAGAFTLSTSASSGTGGPLGAGLSGVLDLSVRDVSGATPVPVFSGKLGALSRVALGTFAPGATHRYRFELTYPAAFGVNAYQGASTTVRFDWDAVAVGGASAGPAPVAPTPAPVPSTPVGSAGGTATPSGTTTTPAGSSPGTTAPAGGTATGGASWTVALGTAKKAVSNGRLVTWMTSTTASRAKVTGTVTSSGSKLKLRRTTVKLTAKRKTVRLKLPAKAVAGAKHTITVRLTVTASGGGHKATIRKTLRVSSR